MPDIMQIVLAALKETEGAQTTDEILAKLEAGQDVALADLGLESLSRLEVIMHVEETLDVEIDEDEVAAQETVHALVALIRQKRGGI